MYAEQLNMMQTLETQVAAAIRQRQNAEKSGKNQDKAFRDLLNQRTQETTKPEDQLETKPETPEEPTEDMVLDPYRQQLLAAAQAAAMTRTVQPAQVLPQQTAAPVVQVVQGVEPQAPVAQVQPQMDQAAPVQTKAAAEPIPVQTQAIQTPQTQAVAQSVQPRQAPVTETPQPKAEAPQTAETTVGQPKVVAQSAQTQTNAQTDTQTSGGEQPAEVVSGRREEVVTVAAGQEAPVFQKVEAVPVKVGEAPVLDTQTADVDKQLATQVKDLLGKGGDRVELRLNPESLGTVTVELTRSDDGALHVAITAGGEKAASILEKHAAGLEQLLAGSNRAGVQVDVQQTQESRQQQRQDPQQQPYDREGHGEQQRREQQQQRHSGPDRSQDFMQQLRLGLQPLDSAAS